MSCTTGLTRLRSDWIAVRELKQHHDTAVIQLEELNKKPDTVITGIVEQVGPGRRSKRGVLLPIDVRVGQTVYFPIEAGRARLPWDFDVRIMRATEIAGVVERCEDCNGYPVCKDTWLPKKPCHAWTPANGGCPVCGAAEMEAETPRTVYGCGSSDYDGYTGTFKQGVSCVNNRRVTQADLIEKYPVGEVLPDDAGETVRPAVVEWVRESLTEMQSKIDPEEFSQQYNAKPCGMHCNLCKHGEKPCGRQSC